VGGIDRGRRWRLGRNALALVQGAWRGGDLLRRIHPKGGHGVHRRNASGTLRIWRNRIRRRRNSQLRSLRSRTFFVGRLFEYAPHLGDSTVFHGDERSRRSGLRLRSFLPLNRPSAPKLSDLNACRIHSRHGRGRRDPGRRDELGSGDGREFPFGHGDERRLACVGHHSGEVGRKGGRLGSPPCRHGGVPAGWSLGVRHFMARTGESGSPGSRRRGGHFRFPRVLRPIDGLGFRPGRFKVRGCCCGRGACGSSRRRFGHRLGCRSNRHRARSRCLDSLKAARTRVPIRLNFRGNFLENLDRGIDVPPGLFREVGRMRRVG